MVAEPACGLRLCRPGFAGLRSGAGSRHRGFEARDKGCGAGAQPRMGGCVVSRAAKAGVIAVSPAGLTGSGANSGGKAVNGLAVGMTDQKAPCDDSARPLA